MPEFHIGVVVELLQQLIRNRCVNDGSPTSGQEIRNADTLAAYLDRSGVDVMTVDAAPGRRSLIARIQGTDPQAPSLGLLGHTDVVPVNEDGWRHDPFGGELIGGEVWGRGAVDMLNMTASMAVAVEAIVRTGLRPRGDIVFVAVADEEAAGAFGAGHLVEHAWDDVACDYLLTENGGLLTKAPHGHRLVMNVAEKGYSWRRLTIRGTPGHGSMPYGADNALVTASAVIERLANYRPVAGLDELWKARIEGLALPEQLREALLDPDTIDAAIAGLPSPAGSAHFHACTHTTFSPNLASGGVKTNVIPDTVHLTVDIRTLPGEGSEAVDEHVRLALGDLSEYVQVEILSEAVATASPVDTPLWEAMKTAAHFHYPDATLQPAMIVGLTDARFFRDRGTVAYGAGLFSRAVSSADFSSRFHGHNERIDLESLRLTTDFWLRVVKHFGT